MVPWSSKGGAGGDAVQGLRSEPLLGGALDPAPPTCVALAVQRPNYTGAMVAFFSQADLLHTGSLLHIFPSSRSPISSNPTVSASVCLLPFPPHVSPTSYASPAGYMLYSSLIRTPLQTPTKHTLRIQICKTTGKTWHRGFEERTTSLEQKLCP